MNTTIQEHFFDNQLLTDSQHSFWSGQSVEINLIDAYDYIIELLDHDTLVGMILFYFVKAFHKICHH